MARSECILEKTEETKSARITYKTYKKLSEIKFKLDNRKNFLEITEEAVLEYYEKYGFKKM
ncbi:hypothetical protein [Shouchella miscanthi]|uniref:hypothetical protein n=1 Tax=Shouchella miscanthi TaxID=2598861 RepID=UPI000F5D1D08|nr:hypothetical protein [Shouchella miscanthi]RQW20529.1 hypothetical protein EH196_10490 [Bacillus sp. C1-1]